MDSIRAVVKEKGTPEDQLRFEGLSSLVGEGILVDVEDGRFTSMLLDTYADSLYLNKDKAAEVLRDQLAVLFGSLASPLVLPFNTAAAASKCVMGASTVSALLVHDSIQTTPRQNVYAFDGVEGSAKSLSVTLPVQRQRSDGAIWIVFDLDNPNVEEGEINALSQLVFQTPNVNVLFVGQCTLLFAAESVCSTLLRKMWERKNVAFVLPGSPLLKMNHKASILVAPKELVPEGTTDKCFQSFDYFGSVVLALRSNPPQQMLKHLIHIAQAAKEFVAMVLIPSNFFESLRFTVQAADIFRIHCAFAVNTQMVPASASLRWLQVAMSDWGIRIRPSNSGGFAMRPVFDLKSCTSTGNQRLRSAFESFDTWISRVDTILTECSSGYDIPDDVDALPLFGPFEENALTPIDAARCTAPFAALYAFRLRPLHMFPEGTTTSNEDHRNGLNDINRTVAKVLKRQPTGACFVPLASARGVVTLLGGIPTHLRRSPDQWVLMGVPYAELPTVKLGDMLSSLSAAVSEVMQSHPEIVKASEELLCRAITEAEKKMADGGGGSVRFDLSTSKLKHRAA